MRPWTTQVIAEYRGPTPIELFRTLLIEKATENNNTIHAHVIHGYTTNYLPVQVIVSQIAGHCFFTLQDRDNDDYTEIWLLPRDCGFLQITYGSNHVDVLIHSIEKESSNALAREIRACLSETPARGTVHMLAYETSFYLTELGEVDLPLVRENYTPKVLEQYDHIIEDFTTDSPSGRLTILDGEPGTGKSYMIRGIVSAVNALFIYVPASVAGRITGPDIIPVLMREKDKNVPIVLLMEDADSSLATRQLDNVSKLSDLLNMSDGILGDMSDLRIIATTNAKKAQIDRAVMRPGRLNEHIELSVLEYPHTLNIFHRLVGQDDMGTETFLSKKMTLADVYKEARMSGWKPAPIPKRKRRFSVPPPSDVQSW